MDGWFDDLSRRVASATGRREAIKVLAAGLAMVATGSFRPPRAAAQAWDDNPCAYHTRCVTQYLEAGTQNCFTRTDCYVGQYLGQADCNSRAPDSYPYIFRRNGLDRRIILTKIGSAAYQEHGECPGRPGTVFNCGPNPGDESHDLPDDCPDCDQDPDTYILCGVCVNRHTTCPLPGGGAQQLDCCFRTGSPGYWYAEGGICHECG